MHEQKLPTPWDGKPGFWAWVNRTLYPIAGPAQVGIGRPEAPYVAPVDPRCPICGASMARHVVERGDANAPTRLHCPEVLQGGDGAVNPLPATPAGS